MRLDQLPKDPVARLHALVNMTTKEMFDDELMYWEEDPDGEDAWRLTEVGKALLAVFEVMQG